MKEETASKTTDPEDYNPVGPIRAFQARVQLVNAGPMPPMKVELPMTESTMRKESLQVPQTAGPTHRLREYAAITRLGNMGHGSAVTEMLEEAADEIERLQAAINEAYRVLCSGTPPHSARETNARRVLRLAGVTVKEQSA